MKIKKVINVFVLGLLLCFVNTTFGDWIAKTSRTISNSSSTHWKYSTDPISAFNDGIDVSSPSRTNTIWDYLIADDPDPWEKMYDSDHLPTPWGDGYWVSSVWNTGQVDDGYNYDWILFPSSFPINRNSISRATMWFVADDWAEVSIWRADFDPPSYIGLGSTPHIADGGFIDITRIDMTEAFRGGGWPIPVPILWFDLSNELSENQHMGLFVYYSVDYSQDNYCSPQTFTHVYNFGDAGWKLISMPLYITEPSTYPNCSLRDIFDLFPGTHAYFFDPNYSPGWIEINSNALLTTEEPLTGMSYADILRTYSFYIVVPAGNQTVEGLPVLEQRYLDNKTEGYHYYGTTWGTSHPVGSLDDLEDGSVAYVWYYDLATGYFETASSIDPFIGYSQMLIFAEPRNHWDLQGYDLSDGKSEELCVISSGDIQEYRDSLLGINREIREPEETCEPRFIDLLAISSNKDTHIYFPPDTLGIPLPPRINESFGKKHESAVPKVENISLGTYPNPFNAEVSIVLSVYTEVDVRASIFDLTGKDVYLVHNGKLTTGDHEFIWSGCNSDGDIVPSGVYLLQIETNDSQQSHRLILIK